MEVDSTVKSSTPPGLPLQRGGTKLPHPHALFGDAPTSKGEEKHPGQPRGVAPTTLVRVKTSRASGPGDFIFNKFIEEESAVRRSVLCVALSAGLFVCFSGVAWSVNPTGYGQAGGEYDIRIPRVPAGHLAKAKKVKPPFEATPEVLAEGQSHFPGLSEGASVAMVPKARATAPRPRTCRSNPATLRIRNFINYARRAN